MVCRVTQRLERGVNHISICFSLGCAGSNPVTATNSFLHLHFDLGAEPGMACKPSLPIRIQLITSFRFSKFKSSDDAERWVTPPAPFFHKSSANGKDNHSNQNKALWKQLTSIRQTRIST